MYFRRKPNHTPGRLIEPEQERFLVPMPHAFSSLNKQFAAWLDTNVTGCHYQPWDMVRSHDQTMGTGSLHVARVSFTVNRAPGMAAIFPDGPSTDEISRTLH
jgi:hypothetical protein